MAERCVICGQKYARKVSSAHIKTHGSGRTYQRTANKLSADEWNLYWKRDSFQAAWPNPTGENEPVKGFKNFVEYIRDPENRAKFPNLA